MEQENFILDTNNKEQQKAYDLVAKTNTSLFITGKAGTGKTTFVKRIQKEIDKNFLVLAPTGIAAITVGGQTMHSFFQFPLEVITPETELDLSDRKAFLLEKVDTIIVDEASMVRCDLVDAMDRMLKMAFSTNLPFGGKQVVFVGDLCQLPPVALKDDLEILSKYYGHGMPFFYKAHVLRNMNLPKIEFSKVYRQTDEDFINILNKMRLGGATEQDLALLNQHVCTPDDDEDLFITLTAYNKVAESINHKKLNELSGEEFTYVGEKIGVFSEKDCPAPLTLKLKVGAQVIICRNNCVDNCVNGTLATVAELDDDYIKVALKNGLKVDVPRTTWISYEKVRNKETGKLEKREVGSMEQYPLKLAWAITIHKSQGMTFDRMHLDLTRGVFTSGQAYVAISRMRSLEGLTLSNDIKPHHIMVHHEVQEFYKTMNNYALIDDEIKIGALVKTYLDKGDYDCAARVCLEGAISKSQTGDYRNAALLAKRMFDVMLDDDCLLGIAKDVQLLQSATMTGNFLNAVFCLYGNRFEQAIEFADMVLEKRQCLEALFIKGRALYALGQYNEAYDVVYSINLAIGKPDSSHSIDMKQYLFEAKVNEKVGNSNIAICKKLLKLCPVCIDAYAMVRREAIQKDILVDNCTIAEDEGILFVFNDKSVSEEDFVNALTELDKKSPEFTKFKRMVRKLAA